MYFLRSTGNTDLSVTGDISFLGSDSLGQMVFSFLLLSLFHAVHSIDTLFNTFFFWGGVSFWTGLGVGVGLERGLCLGGRGAGV